MSDNIFCYSLPSIFFISIVSTWIKSRSNSSIRAFLYFSLLSSTHPIPHIISFSICSFKILFDFTSQQSLPSYPLLSIFTSLTFSTLLYLHLTLLVSLVLLFRKIMNPKKFRVFCGATPHTMLIFYFDYLVWCGYCRHKKF